MFKKIKIRLTIFNAISYFLFLVIFLSVFFVFFTQVLNKVQEDSLKSYAASNINKFLTIYSGPPKPPEQFELEADKVSFYYVISKELEILYGQELHEGFYSELQKNLHPTTKKEFKRYNYNSEKLLVLTQPVVSKGELIGYIAIGQNVTSYYVLTQNVFILGAFLLILSSIGIGFLSYFLARKSMEPIQQSYDQQKQFVSNASHELRTPLSVLISSMEILEEELKQKDSGTNETIVDMKQEAQYMNDMLNSLLYLARADQHQLKLTVDTIDLSSLLIQRVRRFAKHTPYLKFDLTIDDELEIEGDKVLIEELIDIFLKNAITYTKEGTVKVIATRETNSCIVQISDTGMGISEEDLPYIFDRFYRADKMRSNQGTGLGLSIARVIADLHHAIIKVDSKINKGTTFTIELPKKN